MNVYSDTTNSTPDEQPFAEEDRLADKIIALATIDPEVARHELYKELTRVKLRLMATEKAFEITRPHREVANSFRFAATHWPRITGLYIRTVLVLGRAHYFLRRTRWYLAV